MFYCNTCAEKNKWPETGFKSKGRCEDCGTVTACNDMPSKDLPIPAHLTREVRSGMLAEDAGEKKPERYMTGINPDGRNNIWHSTGVRSLAASKPCGRRSTVSSLSASICGAGEGLTLEEVDAAFWEWRKAWQR